MMTKCEPRDCWATPMRTYSHICEHWGVYPTIDVAANAKNSKCSSFISEYDNALTMDWIALSDSRLWSPVFWMNPPYSKPSLQQFIDKAIKEALEGAVVLFLLPARTDRAWYHEKIKQFQHEFVKGRISFEPPPGIEPSTPRYSSMHGVIRYDRGFSLAKQSVNRT